MTRWARSGSTQKHRKMPEDATPWKEFVKDAKMKSKNSHESKKVKKECMEQNSHTSFHKRFGEHKFKKTLLNTNISETASSKNIKKEQNVLKNAKQFELNVDNPKAKNDHVEHLQNMSNSNYAQVNSSKCNAVKFKKERIHDLPDLNKTQLERTNGRNKKWQYLKTKRPSNNYQEEITCTSRNEREKMFVDDKPLNNKNFSRKKKPFVNQFHENSWKKGFVPLPLKVEQKLQDLNRQLQTKGLPAEEIKNIMRKRRRTEKNKLRKILCSKPCFNCRQRGHLLADCPLTLDPSNQGNGICFKCGSTEHKSSKCTKNIEGYPLAKCFICEKQGHISKDCPQNKHGIYPDGGKCSLCGNINHLRKDCPSLDKKKEEVVSLHIINEGISIDDEITESVPKVKPKISKKPKTVKFF